MMVMNMMIMDLYDDVVDIVNDDAVRLIIVMHSMEILLVVIIW